MEYAQDLAHFYGDGDKVKLSKIKPPLKINCTKSLDDLSGDQYMCFKQDPYFGYITFGIMLLPGKSL